MLRTMTHRSNLTAMVVTSPSSTGRSGSVLLCRVSLRACSRSWVCWNSSCIPYALLQHNTTLHHTSQDSCRQTAAPLHKLQAVKKSCAVPDLSGGLSRLQLLPQRRLHLVPQHLTQAVLCVEGIVVVLDRLKNTRRAAGSVWIHVCPVVLQRSDEAEQEFKLICTTCRHSHIWCTPPWLSPQEVAPGCWTLMRSTWRHGPTWRTRRPSPSWTPRCRRSSSPDPESLRCRRDGTAF